MANIRQLTEDNNQVFYPQTHEKAVIDSNGVALDMKIAGKQDTIQDLPTIRSGAALGSTSVQPVDIEDMVEAEPIGSIIPPVNPSEFSTKEEVSQLQQEVDLSGNKISRIGEGIGYTTQESIFFSAYNENNQANSNSSTSPFFPLNMEKGVVTKIKANFVTAGTFTIGKIKEADVQRGKLFDFSKIILKKTYTILATGVQEITINPINISEDEIIFFSYPGDDATFKYGYFGENTGFRFIRADDKNVEVTDSSLGIDIIGDVVDLDQSEFVGNGILNNNNILELLGVEANENVVIFQGFTNDSSSAVQFGNSPFIIKNNEYVSIKSIKINVITSGTISLGKVKKSNVNEGSVFDRANVFDKVTILIKETGVQNINVNNFTLNEDEYICIGWPGNSTVFTYGGTGAKDIGFLYIDSNESNILKPSPNAIGLDIIAKTFKQKSVYNGKKLSILGDSISTFSGYITQGNATYYPAGTVQSVQDTWWKKLADALGLEIDENNSWSGSRVTTTGGEESAGCMTRCQNLGDPDVIIVWMGINDFNNEVQLGTYDGMSTIPTETTTFREAYGIMLNKILTAYPTAELWVCTLPQCERNGTTGFPEINGNGDCLTKFNKAICDLAEAFGVKVLDHNRCGLTYQNMPVYNPDNLHPNKDGHSLIANNDIKQMDNYIRARY